VTLPTGENADGSRPIETLLEEAGAAEVSPDGRWLAYRSDTSGRWEVYVRRWIGGGALGPERRVSTEGASGLRPNWYAPAEGPPEIWFLNDGKCYSVTLREDPELTLSRPALVAEWRPDYFSMEPLPDGRILMAFLGEQEGPYHRINVVQGWGRDLERRLAASSGSRR
jgi:serine/threonine-protein kinase